VSKKKEAKLTATLLVSLLVAAFALVVYLRATDGPGLPGRSDSYTSESDLEDAETQLDGADLDNPSQDEQALESDLNF
jgi:hypothetical protein